MKVTVKRDKFDKAKVDVLIVPVYQETPLEADSSAAQLDACLDGLLRDYLESGDFPAALNSTTLLRTRGSIPAPRVRKRVSASPRALPSTICARRAPRPRPPYKSSGSRRWRCYCPLRN